MKTLQTKRLILRDLKIEDAEHIFKTWASDKETTRFMLWNTHTSVLDTEKWINDEIAKRTENGYYSWGIELKETGKLIGSMGAYLRTEDENKYEIGYIIAKPYWNKGYTTEAAKEMMKYLINERNIKHFKAVHSKLNPASGKVMEKLGLKYTKDIFCEKHDKTEIFDSKVYYLDVE